MARAGAVSVASKVAMNIAMNTALVLALATGLAGEARAQLATAHVQPEARVDAIMGRASAVQAGAGVNIPAGIYARVGLDGAIGARVGGASGVSARVDAIARFMFDPFVERRWGLSAGGGLSVRYDEGEGWRPFLALVLDLEAPPPARGPVVPALQVGLGGGARLGVVLRRRDRGRR